MAGLAPVASDIKPLALIKNFAYSSSRPYTISVIQGSAPLTFTVSANPAWPGFLSPLTVSPDGSKATFYITKAPETEMDNAYSITVANALGTATSAFKVTVKAKSTT